MTQYLAQATSLLPSQHWLRHKYQSLPTPSGGSESASDLVDASTSVQSSGSGTESAGKTAAPPIAYPVKTALQNVPTPQSLSLNLYTDTSTESTGIVLCPSATYTRKRRYATASAEWPTEYKHCISAQFLPQVTSVPRVTEHVQSDSSAESHVPTSTVTAAHTSATLQQPINAVTEHADQQQHREQRHVKRQKRDRYKLSHWTEWFKSYLSPPVETPTAPVPIQYVPYARTVQRVVIIGIHGWSLMGGLLGVKGNIIANKLCQLAQQAVYRYLRDNNLPHHNITIDTIPLHGHGKVDQRVTHYMDQHLPHHQQKIGQADCIFVVSHSQGTLVATLLMHELLRLHWIRPQQQNITMLNMSGLNHGPYPDLPGDLLPATKELFTYCQCESSGSKRHLQCAGDLLTTGCRLILIGSVSDAVVPLYSALWQGLAPHTHLIRAIYVDNALYQPDFLYALLCTLLYLCNSNISGDLLNANHTLSSASDLLVHLSGFLRGKLLDKNGGAHSAIHREVEVYNCAVEYLFALPDVANAEQKQQATATLNKNIVEPTVNCNSYAMWAVYLTDALAHSPFNKHLLLMRCQQLMQLLRHSGSDTIDGQAEYALLKHLHNNYHPRSRTLRSLRDALIPLYGAVHTIADEVDGDADSSHKQMDDSNGLNSHNHSTTTTTNNVAKNNTMFNSKL